MVCLGLTGGIGSGKSYISRLFTALSIPVYEADTQTKELYTRDNKLRQALISLLGAEIFQGEGLQKEVMAAKIFADHGLLEEVNRLVHPAVMGDFANWKVQQQAAYVILESAIILETPFASVADKTVTVSAPTSLRLERLCHRDQSVAEDAQRRMERQWSDAMREERSDFVIYSDGKRPLLPQVLEVHQAMLKL
ncbi:MAG: dephospho-CoA kinase [Bacteroidetes bacterium]|nr:dephospho-CoA kinase [Bacteroidota bacterium]